MSAIKKLLLEGYTDKAIQKHEIILKKLNIEQLTSLLLQCELRKNRAINKPFGWALATLFISQTWPVAVVAIAVTG